MLENDLAAEMPEDDAVMRIARALQRPEDLGPAVREFMARERA